MVELICHMGVVLCQKILHGIHLKMPSHIKNNAVGICSILPMNWEVTRALLGEWKCFEIELTTEIKLLTRSQVMQLFETPIKTVIFNQIKLKKWQRYQVRILFEPQCTCEANWVQIRNHFWSKPNPKESHNYFFRLSTYAPKTHLSSDRWGPLEM